MQEAVEETETPLKGREAGEPGGEGREGEHGSLQESSPSLGPGLCWDRPSDITGQRCLYRTGEGLGQGQRPGGGAGEPETLDRPARGNQGGAVRPLPLVASLLGLKGKAVNSSAVCTR